MKYNVIFKKEFDSKTESVIDTIEAPYAYCLDDYLVECEHNASDEYNKYLADLFCKGHLVLDLIEFNMLEIKHFPEVLLRANGITQEMINIINETDLQSAESITFTSLADASDYLYDMLYYKKGVIS